MSKDTVGIHFLKNDLPQIIIPWDVFEDIKSIVDARYSEIGWIGEATKLSNKLFRIDKVTVPQQEANAATTEISDEGIFEVIMKNEINGDNFRYWGHSHGDMGVFASGQDDTQMREFAESCEWFVGTIHNRRGDMFGYLVDNARGIYFTNIDIVIEEDPAIQEIENEISKLEFQLETARRKLLKEYDTSGWKPIVQDRVKHLITNAGSYYGNYSNQKKTPKTKDQNLILGLPNGNLKENNGEQKSIREFTTKEMMTNGKISEEYEFITDLDVEVDNDGVAKIEGTIVPNVEEYLRYYDKAYSELHKLID
ncbi:MAG: hypothetical protein J5I47_08945 [Vicingus serpentipes]|nr:hypothetical protein [Vicingus serpentipes]